VVYKYYNKGSFFRLVKVGKYSIYKVVCDWKMTSRNPRFPAVSSVILLVSHDVHLCGIGWTSQ